VQPRRALGQPATQKLRAAASGLPTTRKLTHEKGHPETPVLRDGYSVSRQGLLCDVMSPPLVRYHCRDRLAPGSKSTEGWVNPAARASRIRELTIPIETNPSLRFWRVAFWGTVTFVLFSVSFWTCFRVFTSFLVETRAEAAAILPGPFLPSVISGVLALLCVMLALLALWKLQLRREAAQARYRFASHKGNAELSIRLFSLVVLLAIGLCVPKTSHMTTCRCCLFTVRDACNGRETGKPHAQREPLQLSPRGSYDFDSFGGRYSGIYPPGQKFEFDKFALDDVPAVRTQFGWPVRSITRDVVPGASEWHVVFEDYAAATLLFWFLGWLCTQPMIGFAKWLFTSGDRSRRTACEPAGTFPEANS
jgi:hypothetical protein